jgi:hypothetical protein
MSRVAKPWLVVVSVSAAVGAGGAVAAEVDLRVAKPMNQAAIERSWAIQAQLAGIEADKEAFVDELLASWAPYLERNAYDPEAELKAIAMAAYPWRLLGASLVGDFPTMVGVLKGRMGAGQYINALDKPAPRVRPDSKLLGDTTNSLVYTPIAPCRIVDTRGTGARTGILVPGAVRSFDLTTSGFTKGQGGDTACPGLPSFSHAGWNANITVTGHSTNGGLQVWGFNGPVPSTSFLNFFPAGFALANDGGLTGCFACGDDISISAFGGPVHVIVDVMGFYEQASGFPSGAITISAMAGPAWNIAANTSAFVNGAPCPAGTTLVSGGMRNNSTVGVVTSDHERTIGAPPSNPQYWIEYLRNNDALARTATVFSYCIDVN